MKISKKIRGYTLTELIIVIIIMGILAIGASIKWSYSTTSLDSQIALLVSDLRYAQNLSVAKNERCRLVINTGSRSYEIRNSTGVVQPLPNGKSSATLIAGISFGTLTNITSTIIFDGKGIPYTDTSPETLLTTAATITLQNNSGQTRTITIAPTTGNISS